MCDTQYKTQLKNLQISVLITLIQISSFFFFKRLNYSQFLPHSSLNNSLRTGFRISNWEAKNGEE